MEKYYTPELEEFHVGFEYEHLAKGYLWFLNGLGPKDTWMKETFSGGAGQDGESEVHELDALIEDKAVRVKHLDREDIESFGFKRSNLRDNIFLEECDEWNHRPAECIGINFNEGFDHIMIFFVEKGGKIKHGQTIFAGKLNNKSELKRLLKQLEA